MTPTVTMKTAGTPKDFVLSRSNGQNGALANYVFSVTLSSFYY